MDRRYADACACVLVHLVGKLQLFLMQFDDTARDACSAMFFSAFLYHQKYTVERKNQQRGVIQTQILSQQGGLTSRFVKQSSNERQLPGGYGIGIFPSFCKQRGKPRKYKKAIRRLNRAVMRTRLITKMSRRRSWCFTKWEDLEEFQARYAESRGHDGISYICWGEEICPESGRDHLQGYVEFTSAVSLRQCKLRLEDRTVHVEPRGGTQQEAIVYCQKV